MKTDFSLRGSPCISKIDEIFTAEHALVTF
jgi:hypothetical protein